MAQKTYGDLFTGFGGATIGAMAAGLRPLWGVEYRADVAAVANANLGGHVRVADVLDCDPADFEPVDVLHASPPCFPAGVTVLTDGGLVPIENIRVGDLVLTHAGRYRAVTNIMSHVAPTIVLEGQGHWGIEATREHPFLSSSRVRIYPPHKERRPGNYVQCEVTQPVWVAAELLEHKHWLSLVEYPELPIPPITAKGNELFRGQTFDLGEDFFWIVGAWLGDGWTRYREAGDGKKPRGDVLICAGKHEAGQLRARLDEAGIRYTESDERTTARFSIHSRPLARWLIGNFGVYAHGKSIPAWLLGAPVDLRRAFLDGYWFADGCDYQSKTDLGPVVACSTVSPFLAVGLRMIGVSLGYAVSIKRYARSRAATIEARGVNERPTYSMRFSESDRHSYQIGNYRSGCVRKIRDGGDAVTVYDISVSEDESFLADGIVVHNCPNFSVAKAVAAETPHDLALASKVAEFVTVLRPGVFTLENVRAYQGSESWRTIEAALTEAGYWVDVSICNSADFAVPQTRIRMIVRAVLGGFVPYLPVPVPWIGWYAAVADLLPGLPYSQLAPWQLARLPENLAAAIAFGSNGNAESWGDHHAAADEPMLAVTAQTLGRSRAVLVGRSNRNMTQIDSKPRQSNEPAFTITAGTKTSDNRAVLLAQGGYDGTVAMASGEMPAGTVTANTNQSSQKVILASRVVSMSPRCLARFQSFPDWFVLSGKRTLDALGIGNAVPPLMMQRIFEGLAEVH